MTPFKQIHFHLYFDKRSIFNFFQYYIKEFKRGKKKRSLEEGRLNRFFIPREQIGQGITTGSRKPGWKKYDEKWICILQSYDVALVQFINVKNSTAQQKQKQQALLCAVVFSSHLFPRTGVYIPYVCRRCCRCCVNITVSATANWKWALNSEYWFCIVDAKSSQIQKKKKKKKTNQVNPVSAAIQYDCVHINDSAMATDSS